MMCHRNAPNSLESRPAVRPLVRDQKRPRPSGIAMMAANVASRNAPVLNPWFRARVIHLGVHIKFCFYYFSWTSFN